MKSDSIHLAPGVPEVKALGPADFAAFFGAPGAAGLERAEFVHRADDLEIVRYPLPGTPDEHGRVTGRASGVGTGWIVLRRFRGTSPREFVRARFTNPRSLSLAEREWNLFCHLRANGVSTPEPLAVGRGRGALLSGSSFLLLRELDHLRPLPEWRASDLSPRAQVRLARAVGRTLARVFRCGVWLPALDLHSMSASAPRERIRGTEACALHQIAERQGFAARAPFGEELSWSALPEVALTDVRGGGLVRAPDVRARRRMLVGLERSMAGCDLRLVRRLVGEAIGAVDDDQR